MSNYNRDRSISDYPIPDSAKIERQVLSDLVGNPDTIGEAERLIGREMFTSEDRAIIYDALVLMYYEDRRIDYNTLYARVGQRFITEVVNSGSDMGATSSDTLQHVNALIDVFARRRGYEAAITLLNLAVQPTTNEDAIAMEAEQLSATLQGTRPQKEEATMPEAVNELAEEIEERIKLSKEGRTPRTTTGFPTLDSLTYGGWGPGQLIILAARPSVGKTAVMLQMAREAARQGFPGVIFSLEMTKSELVQRMLFSTGMVSPEQVVSGDVGWDRFNAATSQIASLPIIINDTSRQLRKIASKITILAKRGDCKVAFIDYLGLVRDGENSKLPLYQQIANITGTLKAVAKAAGVPVVLLCQLNRASASEGRPPQLYDLRDSGSIEQDADIVLMLDAEKDKTNNELTGRLDLYVRKNRQYRKEVKITLQPNETYSHFHECRDFVGSDTYQSTAGAHVGDNEPF